MHGGLICIAFRLSVCLSSRRIGKELLKRVQWSNGLRSEVKWARARQNFVILEGGLMSTSSCIFLYGNKWSNWVNLINLCEIVMFSLAHIRGRPLMIWGGPRKKKSRRPFSRPEKINLKRPSPGKNLQEKIILKRHSRGKNKSIFDFSSGPPTDH